MKDNRGEGQHHDITKILLNCNYYFVEVGGIREKRRLKRDFGQRAEGSLDRGRMGSEANVSWGQM